MSSEATVQDVLARLESAWRHKQLDGLDLLFDEDAAIVGPGYTVYAQGRQACTESYREFALNAAVLSYEESEPTLRLWEAVAIYTFRWKMEYQREKGPKRESGTDQLVLERSADGWQIVWRYIDFAPTA